MPATIPLQPGGYYHIFNFGKKGENLFREVYNYHHFLLQYNKYVMPIVDTYAYCLLPNHFHILFRVTDSANMVNIEKRVEQAFSTMFSVYVRAINRCYDRKGALFQGHFMREAVKNKKRLKQLVWYIHANPVMHRFADSMDEWQYSSYHTYTSNTITRLRKEECLSWFGGQNEFVNMHQTMTIDQIDNPLDLDFLADECCG